MDKFKLTKPEFTNRTLRFPNDLWIKVSELAQSKDVSANAFILQAIEFAIEHIDTED